MLDTSQTVPKFIRAARRVQRDKVVRMTKMISVRSKARTIFEQKAAFKNSIYLGKQPYDRTQKLVKRSRANEPQA